MSSNIKQLQESRNAPYSSPIKAKVISKSPTRKYVKDGQERSWTNLGLADPSGCIKATVYDESKLSSIKEGSNIMIRNYILRDKTIIITKASKTAVTGGVGVVPSEVEQAAKALLDGPPPAPEFKICDALQAAIGTMVSLKGKVVRIDDVCMRRLQTQEEVPVRSIILKDSTGQCKVSLWREMSAEDLRIGMFTTITNLKSSFYHVKKETSFNTVTNSKITKEAAQRERMTVIIDGFENEEEAIVFVCKLDGTDEYQDFICSRETLQTIILDEEDAVESLSALIPVTADIEFEHHEKQKYPQITSLQLM